MIDRILTTGTRRMLGAFVFSTLFATASQGFAMALPPGLEEGCSLTGCLVRYWGEDAGGNGHYYGFVPTTPDRSWTSASSEANASSIGDGSVGYLATITSVEEQSFISQGLLPVGGTSKTEVWIGGSQSASPVSSEGWSWVTPAVIIPEAWDYTNWSPGEPNDENIGGEGDEQYLAMWVNYYVAGVNRRGMWNDEDLVANATAPIIGMIIEWEGPDFVPEPGSAALVALGAGLIALRRRVRA